MRIGTLLLRWGLALVACNAALMGVSSLVGRVLIESDEIVVSSYDDVQTDIYLVDVARGFKINFTNSAVDDIEPNWSLDGSQIIFQSSTDKGFQLHIMDASGNNVRPLINQDLPSTPFKLLSPDFTKLAAVTSLSPYLFDLDTETITETVDFHPNPMGAIWSSDNQFIAYTWQQRDHTTVLEVVNMETNQSVMQQGINALLWLEWLPDNRQIVFATPERFGGVGIYRINRDGSDLSQITHLELLSVEEFNLSPDGSKIVFEGIDQENGNRFYILSVQEGDLVPLAASHPQYADLQWSPDGSEITFKSWADDDQSVYSSGLYMMKADGTLASLLISDDDLVVYNFAWRPRSR